MNDTSIQLGDLGHLVQMVTAAEDFGLDRAEAWAVTELALRSHSYLEDPLDPVAAALAKRVLDKARRSV
jgi:hypothetical protein